MNVLHRPIVSRQVETGPPPRADLSRHRRGVTMALVIVSLIIVTTITGSMLRQFHLAHRHQRQLERKAQAQALAESAIERAMISLRNQDDYDGETWFIAAKDLGTNHDAQVTIGLNMTQQKTEIYVEAIYPKDATLQARVRKRVQAGFLIESETK